MSTVTPDQTMNFDACIAVEEWARISSETLPPTRKVALIQKGATLRLSWKCSGPDFWAARWSLLFVVRERGSSNRGATTKLVFIRFVSSFCRTDNEARMLVDIFGENLDRLFRSGRSASGKNILVGGHISLLKWLARLLVLVDPGQLGLCSS